MTTRLGVQNTVIYDVARIHERYALRPDQMLDYKAVKGDSTDNIPGVVGIGEKTAAKLIGQFVSLDGAVRAPRRGDARPSCAGRWPRPGIASSRSRELMRIVRDLPVSLDLDAAGSTTTTARRSSGSSASTSSGR